MLQLRHLFAAALIILSTGCASGLNSAQKTELDYYRAGNLAVEEKNPAAAAALGLLPGGGSFYGREYGYGIANLLLWPASILWDPISGYNAAEYLNYQATRVHVSKLKKKQLDELDAKLKAQEIDARQYTMEQGRINEKFGNGY
jgi:hypothetical protein